MYVYYLIYAYTLRKIFVRQCRGIAIGKSDKRSYLLWIMCNSKTNTVTHASPERDVQISSRRSSRHRSLLQHSRVQAISLRLNSHLEGKLELNSPLGRLYPRTSILRTHEGQGGADPLPPQPALVLQPLYLFSLNTYTPPPQPPTSRHPVHHPR